MQLVKSLIVVFSTVSAISLAPVAWSQCHPESAKTVAHSEQKHEQGGKKESQSPQNIVKVAANAGSFGTLLAAAQAAGFADDLAEGGPYTVLAPTDAAFAKLGENTIKDLLKPENRDKLRAILRYHVISGEVSAVDAVRAGTAETRQGGEVVFSIRNGKLFANDSAIVATDIKAENGVIHVIDTVLIPTASETGNI